jgi:hypothetical protein
MLANSKSYTYSDIQVQMAVVGNSYLYHMRKVCRKSVECNC